LSGFNEEKLAEELQSLTDSFIDYSISHLDSSILQDKYVVCLVRIGRPAIPKLKYYLNSQAELEKELVLDLIRYYGERGEITNKHHKQSPLSSIVPETRDDVNAPIINQDNKENINTAFFKRWGGYPNSITGFSNPNRCPNRVGVQGALWALEILGKIEVVSFLQGFVEHSKMIEELNLPNGYWSVFTLTQKYIQSVKNSN